MRATAALLTVFLVACGRFDDTLTIPDEFHTVLTANISGGKATLTSYTRDELRDGAPFLVHEGGALYLFLYHEEPAALFLENPIEQVSEALDLGRPIPDGYELDCFHGDQFETECPVDDVLVAVRLTTECGNGGVCFDGMKCVPCTPTAPEKPRNVAEVDPPMAPMEVTTPPPIDPDITCTMGQVRFFGKQCETIGDPCPGPGLCPKAPVGMPSACVSDPAMLRATVEALSMAGGGAILLQEGDYDLNERLSIPAGVHLIGACAEKTRLVGDEGLDITVDVVGDDTELRDVSVTGGTTAAIFTDRHEGVVLRSVIVGDGDGAGIILRNFTRPLPLARVAVSGRTYKGIEATNANVELEEVNVSGTSGHGVIVQDATATMRAVRITDINFVLDSANGISAVRTHLHLDRAEIGHTDRIGIALVDRTLANITDTVVHNIDGPPGVGLQMTQSASATVDRLHVAMVSGPGIQVAPTPDDPSAESLVLRDTLIEGTGGRGIGLTACPQVALRRVRVERALKWGIFTSGSTVSAEDLEVRDTGDEAWRSSGGSVVVKRARATGMHGVAFSILGTKVDLQDLEASNFFPGRTPGVGVELYNAPTSSIARVSVEGGSGAVVVSLPSANSAFTISNVSLRGGIAPSETPAVGVRFSFATPDTSVTIERVHTEDTEGSAVIVDGTGVVHISDVRALHLRRWPELPMALLLDAIQVQGSSVSLARADIMDVEGRGVHISKDNATVNDLSIMSVRGDGVFVDPINELRLSRVKIAHALRTGISSSAEMTWLEDIDISDVEVDTTANLGDGVYITKRTTMERFKLDTFARAGVAVLARSDVATISDGVLTGHIGVRFDALTVMPEDLPRYRDRVRYDVAVSFAAE